MHDLELWTDPSGVLNMLAVTDGGIWAYDNLNTATGAPVNSHWNDLNAELAISGLDIALLNSVSIIPGNPFATYASSQISGTVQYSNAQGWTMIDNNPNGLPYLAAPFGQMNQSDSPNGGNFPYGEVVAVDPTNPNILYSWLDTATMVPVGIYETSVQCADPESGHDRRRQ